MGGGMGGGAGAGMMGVPPGAPYPTAPGMAQQPGAPMSPEQEVEMLKAQASSIEEELRAVNARIAELGKSAGGAALVAVVEREKCTACGTCQEVCPTGAISIDDIAHIDPARCNGCGRCVAACPEDALSMRKA